MDILFEQDLVQNSGLSSEALFAAVKAYCDTKRRGEGLPFPLAFLVLPVVFHSRSAAALKSRSGAGALYKAIQDEHELVVGLQRRMECMYRRTLDACSIALSSGWMAYDPENAEFLPAVKSLPSAIVHVQPEVRDIVSAAKRLGRSFAELSIGEISMILEVVF